jgi:hypothetical protein
MHARGRAHHRSLRAIAYAPGVQSGPCVLLGALLATAATAGGCHGGNAGAVAVHWQLVNPAFGANATPCDCASGSTENNVCCVNSDPNPPDNECKNVSPSEDVVIDTVRLRVWSLGDGGQRSTEVACSSCCFACGPLQQTTNFELPPGTYLLALEALRCGRTVGYTPPGVVRTVRAGEITNLDAVEIVIPNGLTSPASCGIDAGTDCSVVVDGGS